jgi:hypothetical protein
VAERALTGTWIMDEVRVAVQKGYRALQVYEFYETGPHITIPKWGRLSVEYINTFFKLKAEASGYPAWVRTPDD